MDNEKIKSTWVTEENFKEALINEKDTGEFMPFLATIASKYRIFFNRSLHEKLWLMLSRDLAKYDKLEAIYFDYGREGLTGNEITEIKLSPNLCLVCDYAKRLKDKVIETAQPSILDFFKESTCICNFCPCSPLITAVAKPENYHHCMNGDLRFYKYASFMHHFLEVVMSDECLIDKFSYDFDEEQLEDYYRLVEEKKFEHRTFPSFRKLLKAYNHFSVNFKTNPDTLENKAFEILNLVKIHARRISFQSVLNGVIYY